VFSFFLFVAACYMQGSRHRHTKAKKKKKMFKIFLKWNLCSYFLVKLCSKIEWKI
jgi:hypothetical protein